MMARKGYAGEYKIKNMLIDVHGRQNVIKLAIGQAADYIVFVPNQNAISKVVEVKEFHSNKFYPSAREKEQFRRIMAFCDEHKCKSELWLVHPRRGPVMVPLSDFI